MFKFCVVALYMVILSHSITIYFPIIPAIPAGSVEVYQFRPNYDPLWELEDKNEEEDFTCPGDGLYPDPTSGCSSFYRCEKQQVTKDIK